MSARSSWLWTTLVLLLAILFRFQGQNWDKGASVHPDERFLAMVTAAVAPPDSVFEYFSTDSSPLNPHNRGYSFFVYGLLPVSIAKTVASIESEGTLVPITRIGRYISATADVGTVLATLVLARLLFGAAAGILAGFLSACCVLQIQHAHFYTVDALLLFFCTLYYVALVRAQRKSSSRQAWIFSGLFLGLACAVKISALVLSPVLFIALVASFWKVRGGVIPMLGMGAWAVIAAIFVFRVASPYAFEDAAFFSLNEKWISNLDMLQRSAAPLHSFPPSLQWTGRPWWFGISQLVIFGLGLPVGIISLLAFFFAAYRLTAKQESVLLVPVAATAILLVFYSTQFVSVMRYFLPAYPPLFALSAYALQILSRTSARPLSQMVLITICVSALVWAVAFTSIYRREHTRITATRWILEHVPQGRQVAVEPWDERMPAIFEGVDRAAVRRVRTSPLPLYKRESDEKRSQFIDALLRSDYIVVGSQRGYGSVARVPLMFPVTIQYYEQLFRERLGFKRVAEFESYPSVFGIDFRTGRADESFSVYDHPVVMIFERRESKSRGELEQLLKYPIDMRSLPTSDTVLELAERGENRGT